MTSFHLPKKVADVHPDVQLVEVLWVQLPSTSVLSRRFQPLGGIDLAGAEETQLNAGICQCWDSGGFLWFEVGIFLPLSGLFKILPSTSLSTESAAVASSLAFQFPVAGF